MSGTKEIWVYSERDRMLPELIGGAKKMAAELSATTCCLVIGPRSHAEKAVQYGVNQALWLGDPAGFPDSPRLVEDYVDTIEKLAGEREPQLFLVGASKRGRAIAGRLAARLGVCVIPDVLAFDIEGGEIINKHLMFAGGAQRVEKVPQGITIATVGSGVFEPLGEAGNPGSIVEINFVEPEITCSLIERKPKPAVSTNLATAKRVVCPGRGLSKQEDLSMVEEMAQALHAEVGCSRPLAEGLDWLPRERYIGVSGANLKADLYVGLGISGQAQHMVGVTGCRVVVAINKDENAPIFKQADYGIVGDLYEIVPALTQALKQR